MTDLSEAYRRFFNLSDDAARQAAASRSDDTLASDERDRLRVKRINDYILQCRERRNGRR